MSKIPFSISDRSITFYVGGRPYSLDRSAPGYAQLKVLVQGNDPDVEALIALTNPVAAVAAAVETAVQADYLPRGMVGVTREAITYNGEILSGVLVERIFDMLADGFDIQPMVRFLENLFMNPADFARDELYLWMETSDLPITEDGHFLAYKNVRSDFTSIHGGTVDNTPGTIVSMPRQDVDPVRDRTCSRGLHFCSKSYLPSFSHAADGHTVLLKINPADVVSIPSDYGNAKGRAWKYEVLQAVEFDIPSHQWSSVYVTEDDADEDYEDYDDEYDEDEEIETLTFPSDLAAALYAAISEIGVSTHPIARQARLDWANDVLDDFDMLDDIIKSFKDLTIDQASALLNYARDIKASEDAETAAVVTTQVDAAEQARIAAINSYGIIDLRSKASKAGLAGAWRGPNKDTLRAYLINHPSKPV